MCLSVQGQSTGLPLSVQWYDHTVPGETVWDWDIKFLSFPLWLIMILPPSINLPFPLSFFLHTSFKHVLHYVPQAPSSIRDPSRVVLIDGSCWTIIGVEVVNFTFNQGLASIQTPVSPFPVITGLEVSYTTTCMHAHKSVIFRHSFSMQHTKGLSQWVACTLIHFQNKFAKHWG